MGARRVLGDGPLMDAGRTLAVCLAVALLGLLGLFAYTTSLTPALRTIGAIGGADVGALVMTQGHVRAVRGTGGGDVVYTLVDLADFAAIEAFVPRRVADAEPGGPSLPGAQVRVVGEVTVYRGRLELLVHRPGDLRELTPPGTTEVSLAALAENAPRLAGLVVRTGGRLEDLQVRIDDRRVLLRDGDAQLYAFLDGTVPAGGRVDAYGRLLHHGERERWELRIGEAPDGIVPSPSPLPEGYRVIALADLLAAPLAFEGQAVAVLDVEAHPGELIGTTFVLRERVDGRTYRLAGTVFGWNASADPRGVAVGRDVAFVGALRYDAGEARWRLVADEPTLTPRR